MNLENIITVSSKNGDFSDLGSAISSVASKASKTNPFLVVVGPGVYSISTTVKLAPYVYVEGSGKGVTTLDGSIGSTGFSEAAAVLSMAKNSRISSLTIQNTGSTKPSSIGVYSEQLLQAELENIQILVTNDANNSCGIYCKSASPSISNCFIYAGSQSKTVTNTYGVRLDGNAKPEINNVKINVYGGAYAHGIFYTGQYNLDITNAHIVCDIATQKNFCIFVNSGYVRVRNSELLAPNTSTAKPYAVYINLNGKSSNFFNCVVDGDVGGPGIANFYASFDSTGNPR